MYSLINIVHILVHIMVEPGSNSVISFMIIYLRKQDLCLCESSILLYLSIDTQIVVDNSRLDFCVFYFKYEHMVEVMC